MSWPSTYYYSNQGNGLYYFRYSKEDQGHYYDAADPTDLIAINQARLQRGFDKLATPEPKPGDANYDPPDANYVPPEAGPTDEEIATAAAAAYAATLVPVQTSTTHQHRKYVSATEQVSSVAIVCKYQQDSTTGFEVFNETVDSPALEFCVLPYNSDQLVPGSVVFFIDEYTFVDRNGLIYVGVDPTTGAGTQCGTVDYSTGNVVIDEHPALDFGYITVAGCLTKSKGSLMDSFIFRTAGVPVRDGSLSVRGTTLFGDNISGIAENDGRVQFAGSSLAPGVDGVIDTTTGVVRLDMGRWVPADGNEDQSWFDPAQVVDGIIWEPVGIIPETAQYNCVVYSFLPLDSELLGIEPIRLPIDGRVPIFKSGNVAVLHHTENEALGVNFTDAEEIQLGRGYLSIIDLYDYENNVVDESFYTYDLNAGTVTVVDADGMNALTDGGAQNITANHRIEDMLLISEAQINGYISSVGPITHDYPATGAQLSTALLFGDLAGRVVRLFHQKTWDGVYRDTQSGDNTSAKYDVLNYPFILTNKGSVDQRWVLKFTNSDTVQVIGETLGVLGTYNIENEISPSNPATLKPYFTILNTGWGTGWATSNCVRFDTTAANFPVWTARTTMQGSVEEPTDNFVIQVRGDAN